MLVLIGFLVVLSAVVFVGLRLQGTTTRVDEAGATQIARDYIQGSIGSGSAITNFKVLSIQLTTDAGRPAWHVNVSADVTEAGGTIPLYTSHEWLFVDADSGHVRLEASG